jgi:hypothetical protein
MLNQLVCLSSKILPQGNFKDNVTEGLLPKSRNNLSQIFMEVVIQTCLKHSINPLLPGF